MSFDNPNDYDGDGDVDATDSILAAEAHLNPEFHGLGQNYFNQNPDVANAFQAGTAEGDANRRAVADFFGLSDPNSLNSDLLTQFHYTHFGQFDGHALTQTQPEHAIAIELPNYVLDFATSGSNSLPTTLTTTNQNHLQQLDSLLANELNSHLAQNTNTGSGFLPANEALMNMGPHRPDAAGGMNSANSVNQVSATENLDLDTRVVTSAVTAQNVGAVPANSNFVSPSDDFNGADYFNDPANYDVKEAFSPTLRNGEVNSNYQSNLQTMANYFHISVSELNPELLGLGHYEMFGRHEGRTAVNATTSDRVEHLDSVFVSNFQLTTDEYLQTQSTSSQSKINSDENKKTTAPLFGVAEADATPAMLAFTYALANNDPNLPRLLAGLSDPTHSGLTNDQFKTFQANFPLNDFAFLQSLPQETLDTLHSVRNVNFVASIFRIDPSQVTDGMLVYDYAIRNPSFESNRVLTFLDSNQSSLNQGLISNYTTNLEARGLADQNVEVDRAGFSSLLMTLANPPIVGYHEAGEGARIPIYAQRAAVESGISEIVDRFIPVNAEDTEALMTSLVGAGRADNEFKNIFRYVYSKFPVDIHRSDEAGGPGAGLGTLDQRVAAWGSVLVNVAADPRAFHFEEVVRATYRMGQVGNSNFETDTELVDALKYARNYFSDADLNRLIQLTWEESKQEKRHQYDDIIKIATIALTAGLAAEAYIAAQAAAESAIDLALVSGAGTASAPGVGLGGALGFNGATSAFINSLAINTVSTAITDPKNLLRNTLANLTSFGITQGLANVVPDSVASGIGAGAATLVRGGSVEDAFISGLITGSSNEISSTIGAANELNGQQTNLIRVGLTTALNVANGQTVDIFTTLGSTYLPGGSSRQVRGVSGENLDSFNLYDSGADPALAFVLSASFQQNGTPVQDSEGRWNYSYVSTNGTEVNLTTELINGREAIIGGSATTGNGVSVLNTNAITTLLSPANSNLHSSPINFVGVANQTHLTEPGGFRGISNASETIGSGTLSGLRVSRGQNEIFTRAAWSTAQADEQMRAALDPNNQTGGGVVEPDAFIAGSSANTSPSSVMFENRNTTSTLGTGTTLGLVADGDGSPPSDNPTLRFANYNQAHAYYMSHREQLDSEGNFTWNGQKYKALNADQLYSMDQINAASNFLGKSTELISAAEINGALLSLRNLQSNSTSGGFGSGRGNLAHSGNEPNTSAAQTSFMGPIPPAQTALNVYLQTSQNYLNAETSFGAGSPQALAALRLVDQARENYRIESTNERTNQGRLNADIEAANAAAINSPTVRSSILGSVTNMIDSWRTGTAEGYRSAANIFSDAVTRTDLSIEERVSLIGSAFTRARQAAFDSSGLVRDLTSFDTGYKLITGRDLNLVGVQNLDGTPVNNRVTLGDRALAGLDVALNIIPALGTIFRAGGVAGSGVRNVLSNENRIASALDSAATPNFSTLDNAAPTNSFSTTDGLNIPNIVNLEEMRMRSPVTISNPIPNVTPQIQQQISTALDSGQNAARLLGSSEVQDGVLVFHGGRQIEGNVLNPQGSEATRQQMALSALELARDLQIENGIPMGRQAFNDLLLNIERSKTIIAGEQNKVFFTTDLSKAQEYAGHDGVVYYTIVPRGSLSSGFNLPSVGVDRFVHEFTIDGSVPVQALTSSQVTRLTGSTPASTAPTNLNIIPEDFDPGLPFNPNLVPSNSTSTPALKAVTPQIETTPTTNEVVTPKPAGRVSRARWS